jgi:hypothetical protein
MGMRADPAVEPFLPIHDADGNNRPFFQEYVDVPVHGSQRKGRNRRLKVIVNPLRAGMRMSRPYGL